MDTVGLPSVANPSSQQRLLLVMTRPEPGGRMPRIETPIPRSSVGSPSGTKVA
jgi:hypothetical protein